MIDYLTSLPPATWLFNALCVTAILFIRLIWSARDKWMLSTSPGAREKFNYQVTIGAIGLLVVLVLMVGVFTWSQPTFTPGSLPQGATTLNAAAGQAVQPPPTILVPALIRTATPIPLPSPTPPPSPTPLPTASPTLLPTATASPTPPLPAPVNPAPPPTETPTPTPDLTLGQPPDCPFNAAKITRPGDGAQVEGIIDIYGSAAGDDFAYYKFEFRVPGQEWSYIDHFDRPVIEGALGQWNTDTVPPGVYEFRLLVVDTLGNYPEPCTVEVVVQ